MRCLFDLETRIQRLESTPVPPTAGICKDIARMSLTTLVSSTTLKPARTATDNPYIGSTETSGPLWRTATPYHATATSACEPSRQGRTSHTIHRHAATDAGRAVYKAQQLAWAAHHGANGWLARRHPTPLVLAPPPLTRASPSTGALLATSGVIARFP